jgi:hypothetical protein
MFWLLWMAWCIDTFGLTPGAKPEARLLPIRERRGPGRRG